MKSFLSLLFFFLFANIVVSAQEDIKSQLLPDESADVAYTATFQFDTTDSFEMVYLYDALTGSPEGQMVYKNGNYYMDRNGVLTKLTRSDLLRMFSSEQFRDYRKAKGQWNASIPLFVVGSCAGALAVAGAGLWIYNWIHITDGIYHNKRNLSVRPGFAGLIMIATGLAVGAATIIPAINLYQKGNGMMSSLAYDYNYSRNYEENNNGNHGKRPASNTSMRISVGGTSQGVGIAFHF